MNEIVGKIIIRAGIHAREKKEREKERRDRHLLQASLFGRVKGHVDWKYGNKEEVGVDSYYG